MSTKYVANRKEFESDLIDAPASGKDAESGSNLTLRMFNAVQVLTRQRKMHLTAQLLEVGTCVAALDWCPWLGRALRVVVVEELVDESAQRL